jgi:hypothetical protein
MTFEKAIELQKAQAVWTSEIVEVPIKSGSAQKFSLANASQELQNSTIIGLRCDMSPMDNSTPNLVQGSNANGLNLITEELARKAALKIETEGRIMTVPLTYTNVAGKPYLYAPVYLKKFVASKSEIVFGTALPANTNCIAELQFIVGDRC